MKVFNKVILPATLILFLFSATSCVILFPTRHHDNGRHKGWYKNGNNSHNASQAKVKDKENKESNQYYSRTRKKH